MARDFMIQRYCMDNHHRVRGLRPFVATGPRFMEWAFAGSVARLGEWRFRSGLREAISAAFPSHERTLPDDRLAVAELLLSEGIVLALWSVDSADCLPRDRWQAESVAEVAREIPYVASDPSYDVSLWTIEMLSGLAAPSHFRGYVLDDGLSLEGFPFE